MNLNSHEKTTLAANNLISFSPLQRGLYNPKGGDRTSSGLSSLKKTILVFSLFFL